MAAMAASAATLDPWQPPNIVEVAIITTTLLVQRRSHTTTARVLEDPEAQEEKELIPGTENLPEIGPEIGQGSVERRRAMKREKQLGQRYLAVPLVDVSLRTIHDSQMLTIQPCRGRTRIRPQPWSGDGRLGPCRRICRAQTRSETREEKEREKRAPRKWIILRQP